MLSERDPPAGGEVRRASSAQKNFVYVVHSVLLQNKTLNSGRHCAQAPSLQDLLADRAKPAPGGGEAEVPETNRRQLSLTRRPRLSQRSDR